MSVNMYFTKENLDTYLKELAREFKKLNGTKMPAEIILIGGASILVNYGFRGMTYDIDAIILASSAMKDAINITGERLKLPNGWLNTDFKNTKSYSDKLREVSVFYRTYSKILSVRTVTAEYLVAMKLMSGRKYKNDISDIAGILWEHQKQKNPITPYAVKKAVVTLYGSWDRLPENSRKLANAAFKNGNYETLFLQSMDNEKQSKTILLNFDKNYPGLLKAENADTILEQARKKQKGKKVMAEPAYPGCSRL